MFDPLLTLIAAKASSMGRTVGLVAGTAMVTTALVGGGAVAMTVVSSESDLQEDAAVVQTVAENADVFALPMADSGTVGIDPEEPKSDKPRPPLPDDFTCDESKNHGQNVSAYARSLPKGPGRGEKVSAVAQSDCGKDGKDGEAGEADVDAAEEAEEAEEPKPDQAAKKAAQAERKAARTAEQGERKAAKKAAADERKAAKGGNGKGGGKNKD